MCTFQTFPYQGNRISFDFGNGNKMINATEMAKAFPNKRITNFTQSKSTKDFINLLETKAGITALVSNHGGKNPGTWMHEKLALKFAAWLSPDLEYWVYEKIQELLTTGQTSLQTMTPAQMLVAQANMLLEQEQKLKQHDTRLDFIEAKITTKNEDYYTISGFASLHGWNVTHNEAKKYGKAASKLSRERGFEINKEYDPKYGKINSYHIVMLEETFEPTRKRKEELLKLVDYYERKIEDLRRLN